MTETEWQAAALTIRESSVSSGLETRAAAAQSLHERGAREIAKSRTADAARYLVRAFALAPCDPSIVNTLGVCRWKEGRLREAEACFRRAARLRPDDPDFLWHLCCVVFARKDYSAARHFLVRFVGKRPNHGPAKRTLGAVLIELGSFREAATWLHEACRLDPTDARAFSLLGAACFELRRFVESARCYERSLALKPDADIENNFGMALTLSGEPSLAARAFARAQSVAGANHASASNLLLTLHYECEDPGALAASHCRWAARFESPRGTTVRGRGTKSSERVRIGYMSPDFRNHAVARFAQAFLECHDRSRFDIICYSDTEAEDSTTERFRRYDVAWRSVSGTTDVEMVSLVRRDRVDLLVDLAGHTAGHRLGVFARRAAPVQVSYLGYPNTTGLETMDFRLTDAVADPPGKNDPDYSETLFRLPGCFLCFTPPKENLVSTGAKNRRGAVRFGSFNHLAKVTDAVVALWADILKRVPGSRFVIKSMSTSDAEVMDRVRSRFRRHGIASSRLELHGFAPNPASHLKLYRHIDIALDTFPYNGTTTTCEALWMGVPVVTRAGDWHAARVGASLLAAVGLESLVVRDDASYVDTAIGLARSPERLRALQSNLRGMVASSPLTDAVSFTRRLEKALVTMIGSAKCADYATSISHD